MLSSCRTRVLCAAAVLALAACRDATRLSAPERGAPERPSASLTGVPVGRAVVVFKDTSDIPQSGLALITQLGGSVASRFDEIGVAFVDGLTATALASLRGSDAVAAAGYDRLLNWLPGLHVGGVVDAGSAIAIARGDPWNASYYTDGTQWDMRIIQADSAWHAGELGATTTRVAIVDTGIDYTNRELAGKVDMTASAAFSQLIVAEAGQELDVPIEPQQPGDAPFMDNHFHGTHVASTVASNNVSVASIAPNVTLIAVKVLNFQGSGTFESVASGIRYAAMTARANIINMSLGAEVDPSEDGATALLELMKRTIRSAEKQGTIVISAAGNSGLNLDEGTIVATPCEQSTICVSATGPIDQVGFDQPATYTNFGITAVDVAAPGGNVPADSSQTGVNEDLIIGACSTRTTEPTLAPCRTSTQGVAYFYAYAAGTSMATPHVSGEAAQIKSANPMLSVNGLRDRILRSADDIGAKGRDVYSNWGRINLWQALKG